MLVLGFLGFDSRHATQIMPNLVDRIDLNLWVVLIESLIVIDLETVCPVDSTPTLAQHFILKGGPEPLEKKST